MIETEWATAWDAELRILPLRNGVWSGRMRRSKSRRAGRPAGALGASMAISPRSPRGGRRGARSSGGSACSPTPSRGGAGRGRRVRPAGSRRASPSRTIYSPVSPGRSISSPGTSGATGRGARRARGGRRVGRGGGKLYHPRLPAFPCGRWRAGAAERPKNLLEAARGGGEKTVAEAAVWMLATGVSRRARTWSSASRWWFLVLSRREKEVVMKLKMYDRRAAAERPHPRLADPRAAAGEVLQAPAPNGAANGQLVTHSNHVGTHLDGSCTSARTAATSPRSRSRSP